MVRLHEGQIWVSGNMKKIYFYPFFFFFVLSFSSYAWAECPAGFKEGYSDASSTELENRRRALESIARIDGVMSQRWIQAMYDRQQRANELLECICEKDSSKRYFKTSPNQSIINSCSTSACPTGFKEELSDASRLALQLAIDAEFAQFCAPSSIGDDSGCSGGNTDNADEWIAEMTENYLECVCESDSSKRYFKKSPNQSIINSCTGGCEADETLENGNQCCKTIPAHDEEMDILRPDDIWDHNDQCPDGWDLIDGDDGEDGDGYGRGMYADKCERHVPERKVCRTIGATCPIEGQVTDSNGVCGCPSGEEVVGTKCLPACDYDVEKRVGETCRLICQTGTTKLSGENKCSCNAGGYTFDATDLNYHNTSICKCPDDSAKPANGLCIPDVHCSDGKSASGICCANGKKMPVGGSCCSDGSAVGSGVTCSANNIGNPPVIDLSFPRTFNVHGDLSVRSMYTIGRADRPDYECYAYKTVNNKLSKIRQPSAYCPSLNECSRDDKNRCICKALKSGKYVDITSSNNGSRVGEDNRYAGRNTYCEYAGMDPLRVDGSDYKVEVDGADTVISREFQNVTTTTIPFVPPH